MATPPKSTVKKSVTSNSDLRLVDVYFAQYAESHKNPTNKKINWICVPLIVFSLMGLVWAIPFPYIKFLGSYNGYLNWASFLIAFSIYYYLKLSPTLSYLMLFVLMVFSYVIMEIVTWHQAGGPALWLVCGVVFVMAWVGQFIGYTIEGKKASFPNDFKFLLIGPIWLLHLILRKFSIRY